MNEYISSIKKDYNSYKCDILDLVHAKEMEERINSFMDSLSLQREISIIKRNKMKLKFRIRDGIFKTDIMDIKQNRVNFFKYSNYKKNK